MKILLEYTNEDHKVILDDSFTSYYLILKIENRVVNDIKFDNYDKAKHAFLQACRDCDNYIKKNILQKKDVDSIRENHGPTGGFISVSLRNGKTYKTKRSGKGQYIVVKGKRKYIYRGDTF